MLWCGFQQRALASTKQGEKRGAESLVLEQSSLQTGEGRADCDSFLRWAGNTTDLVLRGDSLPKALAKNYGPEREELTKQHKQGRGAKLPLALPATQA